jgi:hypothetical protein
VAVSKDESKSTTVYLTIYELTPVGVEDWKIRHKVSSIMDTNVGWL